MTTHEALPQGDIAAWRVDDPEITGPLPHLAGVAPDWDWDWDFDQPANGVDTAGSAPPPLVPWYARTSVLLALIGAAAGTLVVATVLLMAPGEPRETTDKLRPVIRTTPPTTRVIVPPLPANTTSPTVPSPVSAEPSAAPSAAGATPQAPVSAEQMAPPPAAGPQDAGDAAADAESSGPQVNVTRAPMSFTPGR